MDPAGVLDSGFAFPVVLQGWGLSVGYNNHRRQFLAHALRAMCGLHCPLCTCARPVPTNHFILQPFRQSVRFTEWEQIVPKLLLHWLVCGVPGPCTVAQLPF